MRELSSQDQNMAHGIVLIAEEKYIKTSQTGADILSIFNSASTGKKKIKYKCVYSMIYETRNIIYVHIKY